jgi:hypothetical protein
VSDVALTKGEWKIDFNDKHYGPDKTQGEAIGAAVDAGRTSPARDYDA